MTTQEKSMGTSRPWGIHAIGDIYHPDCQSGLPDGRWVAAVAIPYTGNRLVAAWWVFTGRAYAMLWPKAGDLENIWRRIPPKDQPKPSRPFVIATNGEIKGH